MLELSSALTALHTADLQTGTASKTEAAGTAAEHNNTFVQDFTELSEVPHNSHTAPLQYLPTRTACGPASTALLNGRAMAPA